LIAIQGPASAEVLQPLSTVELQELQPFSFAHGHVADARVMVARTGYTGEDGFEIFMPPNMADAVWRGLLEAGRSVDIVPVGLGARDTLRLEAAMRLYGNDIDESTTALEAGLGWTLGWNTEFIGRDALREQKEQGVARKLVGFEMVDRGIARHGYPIVDGKDEIGVVTSGTHSPTLKKAIGLAYLPLDKTAQGSEFNVLIRGKETRARVIPTPFYKRAK
jgi:aminomethyltransferase